MAESSDDEPPDTFVRKLWDSGGPPKSIRVVLSHFLAMEESEQIYAQLQQACIPNKQVLWSGMYRKDAQEWADKHGMQTLTTAMGPLMDTSDSLCPRQNKSYAAWSRYIHGASAVFSWYIAGGDLVTVLSQPPPQRFNPTGEAYYQTIEEPIIMGKLCNRHVGHIRVVHPCIKEAQDFTYEMWPEDHSSSWINLYGRKPWRYNWRSTTLTESMRRLKVRKVAIHTDSATVLLSNFWQAKLFPGETTALTARRSTDGGIPKENIAKNGTKLTTTATKKEDLQVKQETLQSNLVNKTRESRMKQKLKLKLKGTKQMPEDKPKGYLESKNGKKPKTKTEPVKVAETKGLKTKEAKPKGAKAKDAKPKDAKPKKAKPKDAKPKDVKLGK
ncbi:hypothetical protein VFPPC_11208 [Pochonia chlamydosporia 170]|uniref:Uncharacterized protein n=1 Tax=Pochonia chlamydosporia 170 TaxID=1380566 RepID=A0A179FB23_METCM|nr:hypothetical protein VFPPC_11208 [Pochonia chlamydosporia 170]OAQ62735.1 hypothetical protein VFPPC_11208 [Pochonia chlamydosporia 170]